MDKPTFVYVTYIATTLEQRLVRALKASAAVYLVREL